MEVLVVLMLGAAALFVPVVSGKPNPGMTRIGWLLMVGALIIWIVAYS